MKTVGTSHEEIKEVHQRRHAQDWQGPSTPKMFIARFIALERRSMQIRKRPQLQLPNMEESPELTFSGYSKIPIVNKYGSGIYDLETIVQLFVVTRWRILCFFIFTIFKIFSERTNTNNNNNNTTNKNKNNNNKQQQHIFCQLLLAAKFRATLRNLRPQSPKFRATLRNSRPQSPKFRATLRNWRPTSPFSDIFSPPSEIPEPQCVFYSLCPLPRNSPPL